jgi:hypothetical protein
MLGSLKGIPNHLPLYRPKRKQSPSPARFEEIECPVVTSSQWIFRSKGHTVMAVCERAYSIPEALNHLSGFELHRNGKLLATAK